MAANNSVVGAESLHRQINDRVIIVQLLVMIFLCINLLLIMTFFKRECFYTTTRYILFAVMLVSDSIILLVTDILLVLSFLFTMRVGICIILCFTSYLFCTVTPVTLTAMTLERYVAICMPLRHGELCSTRNTMRGILIIHGLSFIPCIIIFSIFLASVSLNVYTQYKICSVEIFLVHQWQDHLRSAINQFYFLIMCFTIVFSYVKIMKVARAASGEDKKSTWKGLRTVLLHGFQLLLCLIQLWCPFIETAVLQTDLRLFINVRYFNYIIFNLAPRCLSPLIYGLRDEKFFLELKSYSFFHLFKKKSLRMASLNKS